MPGGFLYRRGLSLKCSGSRPDRETTMQKPPKKKEKCANSEGKGLIKLGDKKVKCQRCGGTGFKT
jgi:hypothetical protein